MDNTNKTNDHERLLTPNQAATRPGFPVSAFARWRSERRELPYVTVGRLVRYRRFDLDRWIEDNTVYPEK